MAKTNRLMRINEINLSLTFTQRLPQAQRFCQITRHYLLIARIIPSIASSSQRTWPIKCVLHSALLAL